MKDKEISYRIYLQARRFEDSAELLFKVGQTDPNKYYIPAWVNAAFGLELYLKSILQFEKGTIKKVHSIKDLFKELTEESRNKIQQNFIEDIIKNPPQNLKEIEKQSGVKIRSDFESVIQDISSLFVDFRYIFEPKNEEKSFFFIENLRQAITQRVAELGINTK